MKRQNHIFSQENPNFLVQFFEIDNDFEFKSKTWEQVGEEQTEKMGRENMNYMNKTIVKAGLKKRGNVPTIYDLMKRKEEKDKTSIVGKDIEIVENINVNALQLCVELLQHLDLRILEESKPCL